MGFDPSKSGVRSDINITPLVDVVLVLLIIFMVITPMLQRGKSVELPKAKHAVAGQGAEPAFISVTKDGSVFVEQDKKPATQEDVMAAMRAAAEAGKRVMIKADTEAEYGKVRPVLDWASKAKLKGVSLAAEELKGAK
jgi:biopolymer transport protein ExbD/biopolymer transport protein TolR